MTSRLRTLVALPDDVGLIPSTHMIGGSKPSVTPVLGDLVWSSVGNSYTRGI